MKILISLILFTTLFSWVSAQETSIDYSQYPDSIDEDYDYGYDYDQVDYNYDLPYQYPNVDDSLYPYGYTQEAEDKLGVGELSLINQLSMVDKVSIYAFADSAKSNFKKTVEVEFDNISELIEKINQIEINLELENPQDQISVSVYLQHGAELNLFSGRSNFYLEKKYDKEGNVSYQVPSYAISVFFTKCGESIYFKGLKSAKLVDKEGNEKELPAHGYHFYVADYLFNQQYDYLVIESSYGSHIYDFRTGERLDPHQLSADIEYVYFNNIRQVDPIDGGLVLTLNPEYNYTPIIETSYSENSEIVLDIESLWGFEPIAVHITNLESLRNDEDHEILQYRKGMKIQGTGTVYLWFEFSPQVYGIAENGGGKG